MSILSSETKEYNGEGSLPPFFVLSMKNLTSTPPQAIIKENNSIDMVQILQGGLYMGTRTTNVPSSDSQFVIADVLSYLIKRSGASLYTISEKTGIKYKTLCSIKSRASSNVSLRSLKALADFFGEDVTIFLGLDDYEKPIRLSAKEKAFMETYRNLNDEGQARVNQLTEDYVGMSKYRRTGRQDAL